MNRHDQLRLQAYLDGELSERAARRVARWLARDPAARALETELRTTKTALAGNEPEVTVPETREFYWSKIERAIRAAEARAGRPAAGPGWFFAWKRFFVPVSALALVALVAGLIALFGPGRGLETPLDVAVVDTLSEHVRAHSFRSHSDKLLVIWLEDRAQAQNGEVWRPEGEEGDLIIQ